MSKAYNLQDAFLVPLRVEGFGLVASVVSRLGIGRQIKSAEWVAAAAHVLANQVTSLEYLQVDFQVRFLRCKVVKCLAKVEKV